MLITEYLKAIRLYVKKNNHYLDQLEITTVTCLHFSIPQATF